MTGLMANMSDGSKRAIDDLCDAREMAFVVTDLESSTAQASASAAAFAKVQEIHDTVCTPQSHIVAMVPILRHDGWAWHSGSGRTIVVEWGDPTSHITLLC